MNVITWNMFGGKDSKESKWTKSVTALFNFGADVVCLQECGDVPGSTVNRDPVPPWNVAPIPFPFYYVTWTPIKASYVIFMIQTNFNNIRVNLALCTPITSTVSRLYYAPAGDGGSRPAIGFDVTTADGSALNIFTVHANSSTQGADAPALIGNIDAAVNQFGAANSPFCAAGDFNRGPGSWAPAFPVGSAIIPPDGPTFQLGDLELDYCVLFPAPAQQGGVGQVKKEIVDSDHFPVLYVL